MVLRFFDTAVNGLRDFLPIHQGKVGVYYCGATVQGAAHIGHARSAIVYDQLIRWLRFSDFEVTSVRNVTDIDDKILVNAQLAQQSWWALAYRFEREYSNMYAALNILPVDYEPRATGHVVEMVDLIERLLANKHAYVAQDGSADVYFDVASWAEYGVLTRQTLEYLDFGDLSKQGGKLAVQDFALWKGYKSTEPFSASWSAPWGRGRPGWHLECSAMGMKYLGDSFDIHGGGLDLRFPHHENEIAQSCAAGAGFANYWLHNGLVHVGGQKMSKSLGNSVFVSDLFSTASPLVVRYYLGCAHYRSVLDYSVCALLEAANAVARIEKFLQRSMVFLKSRGLFFSEKDLGKECKDIPSLFVLAMDDDLGVPAALAVLHDTVRFGNAALDSLDGVKLQKSFREVVNMLDVLGINPLSQSWSFGAQSFVKQRHALEVLVEQQLERRVLARKNKDFVLADAIRDNLSFLGIVISDSVNDVSWDFE